MRQFILLREDNEIHMKHYKLQNHRLARYFTQVHNYMYPLFVMRFINQLPLVRMYVDISEMKACIGIKPSGMESALVGLCRDACTYYLR